MAFTNALHSQQMKNNIKNVVIGILSIIIFAEFFLLATYPNRLRIDLPPDLSQAQSLKPGHIYPSSVHQFASTFFQYVNTWNKSGDVDYKDRRNELRAYITQDFYNALKKDYQDKLNSGELKNRTRQLQLSEGALYKPEFVLTKDGYWVATLQFDLKEHLFGQLVKDVTIEYKLIIVKHNVNPIHNEYQMAIDGFYASPRIIKRNK